MTEENARKVQLDAEAVWEMFSGAQVILTARGKSTRTWDPRQDAKDEILADVMGRSGNLRAPTVRVGDVYLVGFNEEMYEAYLGGAG